MFDNSHIMGSNAVGAMIVAGPDGFQKNQYRKFNIRSSDLTPGDDFAMMREVLERRFKRLLSEAPRATDVPADVAGAAVLRSDGTFAVSAGGTVAPSPQRGEGGGRARNSTSRMRDPSPALAPLGTPSPARGEGDGASLAGISPLLQRKTTTARTRPTPPGPISSSSTAGAGSSPPRSETLTALGIDDVPVVAIAKGPERDAGRETFFVPAREPFKLKPRDPVLYFVQRLRDEAHRFAVGSHRARRKKDIRESGLQEIPGVGPARKRALLAHFGTLKAIERASPADLAKVAGVSAETAKKIYDFFHERAG